MKAGVLALGSVLVTSPSVEAANTAIARLLLPAEAKQVMDASRAPYFKESLDGRRRMMMSEVVVTGGTRRGSKVTLDIEGTGGDGFVWGQVFLELVGGSWRKVGQKPSWRRNR